MFEFARPASARAASRKRPEDHTLNPLHAKISVAMRLHGPMKGLARTAMLLPALAMVLAMGAGCKQKTQPSPDVWAVVNGQEIKRDDVDKYYRTRVNPEGPESSQE